MKYPLEDLLKARRFREDDAANAVTLRRRELERAEAAVIERKKELEEYIQWRIRREAELYDEIMAKQVRIRALDDLKQEIQILREKEHAYHRRIEEAEQQVGKAQAALQQAHQHYLGTVKDRQKIDEHKQMWADEQAQIAEMNLEKEMEDFRVRNLEMEDDE